MNQNQPDSSNPRRGRSLKWLITLVAVVILGVGYLFYVKYGKTLSSATITVSPAVTPSSQTTPTTIEKTTDWKTYANNTYNFSIKYPYNWVNDGQYFSPQSIEHYDIGSTNAPVYFSVLSNSEYSKSNIKYQIDNDKRNSADSTVSINGTNFNKYDLEDYGQYEGEGAGRVLIYVSFDAKGNVTAFHWEEKPALKIIAGNNPAIFEQILSTFQFIK